MNAVRIISAAVAAALLLSACVVYPDRGWHRGYYNGYPGGYHSYSGGYYGPGGQSGNWGGPGQGNYNGDRYPQQPYYR